jgi:rubrerythrin
MAPFLTRREALGGAAAVVVLASCGGGEPPPSTGPRPGSGAALLGSLLALERAAIAAFGDCGEHLSGRALENIRAIRAHEREHASRLEQLIRDLGGEPAPGRSPADYARSFPRLTSSADALRFAEDLKERELRAYLEAVTDFPDLDLRAAAARSCADEANHLAAIRVLRGLPAAEGPFVTGAL